MHIVVGTMFNALWSSNILPSWVDHTLLSYKHDRLIYGETVFTAPWIISCDGQQLCGKEKYSLGGAISSDLGDKCLEFSKSVKVLGVLLWHEIFVCLHLWTKLDSGEYIEQLCLGASYKCGWNMLLYCVYVNGIIWIRQYYRVQSHYMWFRDRYLDLIFMTGTFWNILNSMSKVIWPLG